MMRKMLLTGIVTSLMFTISSCDEDTAGIGKSLTSNVDLFAIVPDTFDVTSRSIAVDAVLSQSIYSYLGRIKDPETSAYITSDYMTQFATLENAVDSIFYPKEDVVSIKDGEVVADSCALSIILNNFTGDSLATMKMTMYELDRPIEEGKLYYTDFDPEAEGYIRADGLQHNIVYSVTDMQQNDSVRNANKSNLSVRVLLDMPYKDKNNKVYDNYGTYLMRTYYEHPEYFKNSYTFTKNVCPGFYFKTTDGVGVMAEISTTRLAVYYRFMKDNVLYLDNSVFYSTEEVLQTTHISNDKNRIEEMAKETEWTYLKTPAGIYTEVTLPVDEIKMGHENDTITSAKVIFHKMNDKTELAGELLKDPSTLLMVERDSVINFFERHKLPDNVTSYLANLSTSYNSYTFGNISALINYMYLKKKEGGANYTIEHPNWNKVVLIPVKTTTTTSTSYYSTSSSISAVNNEMSITSSRLVGGPNNQHDPIRISVIYNKSR
jgi:hypothetical protein